jgi:hypothetical protein
MDIFDCISKCIEDTHFFNDQTKLDTVYYLMQGLTYREIAEKIDKQISYVQRVMEYLRDNGLLYWGRWAPNVYKIGMKKTIAFLSWEDRDVPVEKNFEYTTYVHHVQAQGIKVFVIYTYPVEDEQRIVGNLGEVVTPFYYTHTRFTVPFFKKIDLVREFFDVKDSMKNDEKMLTGTPCLEVNMNHDDSFPIAVYICRYGELLPELTPGILTDKLEQDLKDYPDITVTYERIRSKLNSMKDEGVIYPKNALYLKPLSYQSALVEINTKEIYRIMETFNQFNMLTQVALTKDPEKFYLNIQYPYYQLPDVMEIFARLDSTFKAYISTKYVMSDTIYYKWVLRSFEP